MVRAIEHSPKSVHVASARGNTPSTAQVSKIPGDKGARSSAFMTATKFLTVAITLLGRYGGVVAQDSRTGPGIESCVQVSGVDFTTPCPCGVASFSFSVGGNTTIVNNVVNLAVVIDGSGSVNEDDLGNFNIEKEFAKNITASFADKNLFANGGTASYVQFAGTVNTQNTGTFFSLEDFNSFVDNDEYRDGVNTQIDQGIARARLLLDAAPNSSAAFMFVITDGNSLNTVSVEDEAEGARADGITLFAVGVGGDVDINTLRAISGSNNSVFQADNFSELAAALDEILGSSAVSTVSCPATNVTLTVEYGATVVPPVSFPGATISDDTVLFSVDNLEGNSRDFTVMLDTCGIPEPIDPVVSITYDDDQVNNPDFTLVVNGTDGFTCPPATSPPTSMPMPTPNSTLSPSPMSPPTPTSTPTPSTIPNPTLSPMSPPPPMSMPTPSTIPNPTPCPMSPPTPMPTPTPSPTLNPTPSPMSPPTPMSMPTPSPNPNPAPSLTLHPTKTVEICSNGITGIEGYGKCCALGCGKCKTNDCGTRAIHAGLTTDDCFPSRIQELGVYCDDCGIAPCIINKPSTCDECKHENNKGTGHYVTPIVNVRVVTNVGTNTND